jgi:hypothetical protein
MAATAGATLTYYQGDDIDFSFPITDDDSVAVNMAGGSAVLKISRPGETTISKTCSISTSTITASLSNTETKTMEGTYRYELKAKSAGAKQATTVVGSLIINHSEATTV